MIPFPKDTVETGEEHRLDEERLAAWLFKRFPELEGELAIRKFKGGQSNPTYFIGTRERGFVLRKKPPGKLLPSAHQVEREYRVLHALRDTDVPVARVYDLEEDESIVGTPFFLMEHLDGRIFWDPTLPGLTPEEQRDIVNEKIHVLAAIHSVDLKKTGLEDYGRHGQYVARQVSRWSKQYEAAKTDSIPEMDALMRYLPANLPDRDETTLAHGDYRIDNLIYHPTEPRILGVIDWELSTLGDPLSDLAYVLMLYDVVIPNIGGLKHVDFETSGIPREEEYVARYAELTGRGEMPDLSYYKAFSLFRFASILQGVYKRSLDGNASNPNAGAFKDAVRDLAEVACGLVGVKAG